jgi:beta-galactosidase/beta-glucuronidase
LQVIATFTLYEADGVTIAASAAAGAVVVAAGSSASASAMLTLTNAQCWSVARPYLYTLTVTLSVSGTAVDAFNTTVGVRSVRWDADWGAFVNEQRVRFRAYCDHESFAVVGMAVTPRINLFRFQAMRGMGGNGRRFSHNPPTPVLLELADRLGVMTLDENRVFSLGLSPNMVDLVQRGA